MSWAEFILRSNYFNRKRKYEALMIREVAYQSHCAQYAFSDKKPPTKERFWNLDEPKQGVNDERKEAFLNAMKIFVNNKNNG
jgi:hypothetical protein